MGCGSSLPKAEVFLSVAQPAPAEGFVAANWPRSIKMKGWSNCLHAYHNPTEGGTMGVIGHVISNLNAEMSDDIADTPDWNPNGCGQGGCGKPEELEICDEAGQPLGSLLMPRHLSFAVGAKLKDSAGNVLALLCSAESKRPHGISSSGYHVLVPRPQSQGQSPVSGSWYA